MQHEYKVYIKGMVCQRCISAIHATLQDIGMATTNIALGEVTVITPGGIPDTAPISQALKPLGFSILEDKNTILVREIKDLVSEVYSGEYDFHEDFRFSNLIKEKFLKDYDLVSSTFSTIEGVTIEKYVIKFRVEKVKELLMYTRDSLSTIAFKLGFSSVAHLSSQFKTVTGVNTSYFKELKLNKEFIMKNEDSYV